MLDHEGNPLPEPVSRASMTCYGIVYLATTEDADRWDRYVRATGQRFNGGWYDGQPCGRDASRDPRNADGDVVSYAVTIA